MMLNYKAIEILTSEQAKHRGVPLMDAVIRYVLGLRIAARCMVTRGLAGCYENGEEAGSRIEILLYNMPVRIYIVLPAAETERVLEGVNAMVEDGIILLHDLNLICHKTRNSLFPRQLLVRDVMTSNPITVKADTRLSDAATLLLSSVFTGLPVVDERGTPIGILTQGDLLSKGGLPLRLGLLADSDPQRTETAIQNLSSRKVAEVMTQPVVVIADDRLLTDAVEMMLDGKIKRLPVTDKTGRLVGILSRLDIFKCVMRETPDWKAFAAQKIEVTRLTRVSDIVRRDIHAVSPKTPIDSVIQIIDQNDIRCVVVVDADNRLMGLISDRDLLRFFKHEEESLWTLLSRRKPDSKTRACREDLHQCLARTNADEVMITGLITVPEDMLIEDAIGLMTKKALKRLPVVDVAGHFSGMISRDSLLRTGFGGRFSS